MAHTKGSELTSACDKSNFVLHVEEFAKLEVGIVILHLDCSCGRDRALSIGE